MGAQASLFAPPDALREEREARARAEAELTELRRLLAERDQELAAVRSRVAPAAPAEKARWEGKRPTYCAQLRGHMKEGVWYRADELAQLAGSRFAARLHEISRGDDGGTPTPYEWRYRAESEASTLTEYRLLSATATSLQQPEASHA